MINDLFLLTDLDPNIKNEISALLPQPVNFKKGEVIYCADSFKNALGYIISGKASATANNSDGIYMKSFNSGAVFGAAAIFGNEKPYVSKIIAENDTKVLFIDEETLKLIFKKYPQTALNYIAFLSDKIRFLNQKLGLIACTNAEDTVYKYLIENMDSENTVKLPVSMTLLSKMLNLVRATLYRSFDSLEIEGKIKREKNIIKVI